MNDFYTIGQITTDCRKLIEIAETERQTADTTREKFLSGALYAFRAMLRLLELVPDEKFQKAKNKREVLVMNETIYPFDVFQKRLQDFDVEQLAEVHRLLFELQERREIDDLLYSGNNRQTSLNRVLDAVSLLINHLLIAKLLEQKGRDHVSR